MKKLVYTLIALMVLTVFMVGCTTVVPETDLSGKGPNGQAGNSNIAHLYLYEKDPDTWIIKEDGAWGKMKYNLSGEMFEFIFNGHGLEAGFDYTLIYYPDPWPGNGLICLGNGTANKGGEVHIAAESRDIDFLPVVLDDNFPDGAKIWLVLTKDVGCDAQVMVGWQPTEYLFEHDLIQFNIPFISDEFTFSANSNLLPVETENSEDDFNVDTNTLTTDGSATTNYYLHILDGPELKDDLYELYLTDYSGDVPDLLTYYNNRFGGSGIWFDYLVDAANGDKPFAYIQGGTGTPLLFDAAQHDLIPLDAAMTIPGDYPKGIYTVDGKVETSDGWKAVTFDLTIE
jgi:hypothetical protein